ALILPFILMGVNFVYVAIHRSLNASFYPMSFIRFILCFLVLVIPTTLMGGTLPVISKALTNRINKLGWTVGMLYSVNTFGAVVGCFFAGFMLIRTLGMQTTTFIACGINILIAIIIIFVLARKVSAINNDDLEITKTSETPQESLDLPKNAGKIALWVFGISGFCALAYEVLWTRILVMFLGSTAYAFATMLSSFLLGIAIGSIIFAKVSDKRKELFITLGIIQIIIALSAILLIPVYGKLYDIGLRFQDKGWLTFVLSKYALSFLVMIVPTIFMGATFPLVSKIYTNSLGELGKKIGNVYSINTVGSIFGSLLSGFVFIPLIGVQRSIMLMAFFNILAGIIVIVSDMNYWRSKDNSRAFGMRLAYISIAIVAFILASIITDTGQPLTKYTAVFKGPGEQNKLLFYKEGIDTSVTVVEDPEGVRRVFVDTNQAAEDSRWDLPSHNLLAHIPLLLHPNPKNSLVIGFGMGVTSWAVSRYGVAVDAVEISPGIVEANKFFTKINHNVLSDPLVKLNIDDGRSYTLTTNQKYDMISTGIIHPLVSTNSAGFYTKDFYELCKKRLTDTGIMCQWVPLHRLPEDQYKMIIRTFKASFPHTSLWYKYTPDFIILIGTPNELTIDLKKFIEKTQQPAIKADLASVNMDDPYSILDSFMMDEKQIDAYVGEGPIHTDNHPLMEFFGPQPTVTTLKNLDGMSKFRTTILPYLTNIGTSAEFNQLKDRLQQYFDGTQYLIMGQLYYITGDFDTSMKRLLAGSYINPNDANIKWMINHVQRLMGISEETLKARIDTNEKDADAHEKLGTLYQNQGKLDKAIEEFKKAIAINPNSLIAHSSLAYIYEGQNKIPEAIEEFKELIRIQPNVAQIHVGLGLLYDKQGMFKEAIASMRKGKELDPKSPVASINIGIIYQKQGMLKESIAEFEELTKSQPNTAAFHGFLGNLYREVGNYDKAETSLRKAQQLDPSIGLEPNFMASLAMIYLGKGNYVEAEKEINKAINLDPNNNNYKAILEEIKSKKK
ncbi:TPA: tetratricopeptide repeat protein, partial [bacterium]|nr:tetratricopeptide repeat protein [bacterium]